MSEHVQRVQLPPSELGENRCFEIGYFGHGDIIVSTWEGTLDHEVRRDDGISTRFGFTHGSDAMILASMAGFLVRAGKDEEAVSRIMCKAGEEILSEGVDVIRYHYGFQRHYIEDIADGDLALRFDDERLGLDCLVAPTPAHPGHIETAGGTAIYTRVDEGLQQTLLVFGRHAATRSDDGVKATELDGTAEFCAQDIPAMARVVCKLALGDYRDDIHLFLACKYTREIDP